MIDKSLNLFSTLLIADGKLINLKEHISKLKLGYFSYFGKKWLFDENDLIHFLSQQELKKISYRLNIFASNPPSFKITPYDADQTENKSLKIYPKPFYIENAHLKKTNFSKRLSLKNEAQKNGYEDYIFTDEGGHILETTFANIFWINNGVLFTPSKELPLYFGVTLQKILKAATKLGYQIREVFEKDSQKISNSQVFICNSLKEICPISTLGDQKCIYNAKVIKELTSGYEIERQSSLLPSLLSNLVKY